MNHNDNDLKRNASGYYDPTAYKAIKHILRESESEEERFRRLLKIMFRVCELLDFHLEGRIVVKDRRTGKVWK